MITEQKIRLFLSLANTLSFTETANQLFITQQAVSKHISQLEEDLGYTLFIRSKRSVKLTPAGERSRRFFQEELSRFTDFLADERDTQLRLNKSLRIGYNNWLNLGSAISTARVRFYELYPDIAHVPERQPPDLLQQKLLSGELDIILVLRRFLKNEGSLRVESLTDYPMSVIVSRELIRSEQDKSLSSLSRLPLIINSFSGETSAETILRARREMERCGLTKKISRSRRTGTASISPCRQARGSPSPAPSASFWRGSSRSPRPTPIRWYAPALRRTGES